MRKKYFLAIAIIFRSIIISVASYLGSTFEYRSKLNVCEEIMIEKADIKSAEFKKLVKLCKRQINLD